MLAAPCIRRPTAGRALRADVLNVSRGTSVPLARPHRHTLSFLNRRCSGPLCGRAPAVKNPPWS
jgi:hypothetical protein